MSHDYHLICLSHDPGLVLWDWDYGSAERVLAVAADPSADAQRSEVHHGCDMVAGCWSGDLIELGCPGGDRCPRPGYHAPTWSGCWADRRWLRLLVAASDVEAAVLVHKWVMFAELARLAEVATAAAGCWSPERIARLRPLLGLPDAPRRTS